jgi:hypothetical protein
LSSTAAPARLGDVKEFLQVTTYPQVRSGADARSLVLRDDGRHRTDRQEPVGRSDTVSTVDLVRRIDAGRGDFLTRLARELRAQLGG